MARMSIEDGLVMQQLLYASEVRSIKDIDIAKMDVKPAELKLAEQLIEQQTSKTFDPAQYKDEVAARIETAVQKKVEGQEITMIEAPEGGAQVIDLMEALRASLAKKAPARAAAVVSPEVVATEPAGAKRKPPKRVQAAQAAAPAARKNAKGKA